MEGPCQQCMAIQATCYRKTRGPGCWGCSKRKTKCSAAAPWEAGKSRGKKGEGSEGPPPPTTLTVDEEVMGLLRRLVGVLEKGAEALAATESRYQKMDEREREYKRMDKQGWVEKVDDEEEDEEDDEEEEDEEEDEEEEEEKAEGADGAGTEMGMEIVEKGMEKGMDEEMGEAAEGMEVEE